MKRSINTDRQTDRHRYEREKNVQHQTRNRDDVYDREVMITA